MDEYVHRRAFADALRVRPPAPRAHCVSEKYFINDPGEQDMPGRKKRQGEYELSITAPCTVPNEYVRSYRI